MPAPNSWAACPPDGFVSHDILQDAINTGVLRVRSGQQLPQDIPPESRRWTRADEVLTWLHATLSVTIPSNRYVRKEWIIPIVDTEWVGGSSVCETSQTFTLIKTITGLMSPQGVYWDAPSQRYYVVDVDHNPTNLYWFNPATATTAADMNYVSLPAHSGQIANHKYDPDTRRIWMCGDFNGGIYVTNLADETTTTLPAGPNGSFARLALYIFGDFVYCSNSVNGTMYIYNKNTLALVDAKLISTITNGSLYFTNAYQMLQVNNEVWIAANQRTNDQIGRYDFNLTYLGTITPSGTAKPTGSWVANFFWQSAYFDEAKNRLYLADVGSNSLYVFNGTTGAQLGSLLVTERQGKPWISHSLILDKVTGDLIWSIQAMTDPADATKKLWIYSLNRDSLTVKDMFVGISFGTLTAQVGTTNEWGASQGNVAAQGGSWATDGVLYHYGVGGVGQNTGWHRWLTLMERYVDTHVSTGQTKPNDPTDPDYLPPFQDLSGCSIGISTTCPTEVKLSPTIVSGRQQLEWEIVFPPGVLNNPNISYIRMFADDNSPTIDIPAQDDYIFPPFPTSRYQKGIILDPQSGRWNNYVNSGGSLIFMITYAMTDGITVYLCGPRTVTPKGQYAGRPDIS